jgi:FkbM family methyltransferase
MKAKLRLIHRFIKVYVLKAYLNAINFGYFYNFSASEISLYVSEKFMSLKKMSIALIPKGNISLIAIGDHTIFWPSHLSANDLPWLHHEVFDSFDANPSSYDHPLFDFQAKKWIIDAGAAEGFFSIFALQKSSAKIYAIEPLQVMQESLRKTLCNYASPDRFELLMAGLGGSSGLAYLDINQSHLCDSKIIDSPILADNENLQKINIVTLDKITSKYSLNSKGLIKMDIEGYEMEALKGASWTLKNLKPALAIAVYHDLDNARLCAEIIKSANSSYTIEFRGYYGFFDPPRPYILFAY